jgi:hypothetical protein
MEQNEAVALVTGGHADAKEVYMQVGILSKMKENVVPRGTKVYSIRSGIVGGIKMNLDLRYQTQIYLGLSEREIYSAISRFSRDAMTAVDIGSALGEYTLFFLQKTSARHVFAFDPDEGKRQSFYNNLLLNGFENDRRLCFSTKHVGERDDDITIKLDSLIDSIESPCVIKVDVDGGELNVLQGAASLTKMRDVRWVVETHSKALELDCLEFFRDAGYQSQIVENAWWRRIVPEQRPVEHNRWLLAFPGQTSSRIPSNSSKPSPVLNRNANCRLDIRSFSRL